MTQIEFLNHLEGTRGTRYRQAVLWALMGQNLMLALAAMEANITHKNRFADALSSILGMGTALMVAEDELDDLMADVEKLVKMPEQTLQ